MLSRRMICIFLWCLDSLSVSEEIIDIDSDSGLFGSDDSDPNVHVRRVSIGDTGTLGDVGEMLGVVGDNGELDLSDWEDGR